MLVEGYVLKVGDKIDTDVIIPAKYLVYTDPAVLAQHVFEPIDPEFPKKASKGTILIAGKAFGMGSSREQAAIALKAAGVRAILAESFARIFYRNAVNNGLPVMVVPNINESGVNEGDYAQVHIETGEVIIGSKVLKGRPLSGIVLEIVKSGGLLNFLMLKRR
ncbi:MAG: 3-isopropylmalate dehydratase small subunit [Thermoprotei archaeon]